MKNLELYDPKKTYYFRTGKKALPEDLAAQYPLLLAAPCVVETDPSHILFGGFSMLSELREQYKIPADLDDREAVEFLGGKE